MSVGREPGTVGDAAVPAARVVMGCAASAAFAGGEAPSPPPYMLPDSRRPRSIGTAVTSRSSIQRWHRPSNGKGSISMAVKAARQNTRYDRVPGAKIVDLAETSHRARKFSEKVAGGGWFSRQVFRRSSSTRSAGKRRSSLIGPGGKRRSSIITYSTQAISDMLRGILSRAETRGIDPAKIAPTEVNRAYFANVPMLKYFAKYHPALLLLPWEVMRAMGVVQARDSMRTRYTFFSHQWQTSTHPFPDLLQLTEHLDGITTTWMWLDWYVR